MKNTMTFDNLVIHEGNRDAVVAAKKYCIQMSRKYCIFMEKADLEKLIFLTRYIQNY